MKKMFRSLLCVVLVVVITATTTLQAFASGKTEYVSEIKMAICGNLWQAKKELAGYIVVESDLNDDQGNGAQSVYLGYKTTTDKSKAITDLRLMDMNGGYSYNDFDEALKKMADEVTTEINGFFDAVKEFQKNKTAGNSNADYAYEKMNQFKDDDQNNKLLGDVFMDESVSAEKLQTIFLEGNSSYVLDLEEYLAIGCSDNWVERLSENVRKVYDADAYVLEPYCETVRSAWDTLYLGLKGYEEQLEGENGFDIADLLTAHEEGSKISFSTELYDEWMATNPSAEQQYYVFYFGTAYNILSSYDYKGGTLVDYFTVPLDDVDYEYLYPIADAMTKGQLQTLSYVGLSKCIAYTKTDFTALSPFLTESEETVNKVVLDAASELVEGENIEIDVKAANTVVSIYKGVDRSLFDAGSGIALTNDALRKANNSDDNSAILQILNNAKWYLTGTAAIGAVACTIAGVMIGMNNAAAAAVEAGKTFTTSLADWKHMLWVTRTEGTELLLPHGTTKVVIEETGQTVVQIGGGSSIAGTIVMGAAIGVTLILAGFSIYKGYYDYMNPDYKTVPRAIVDENTEKVYNSYGVEVGTKSFYYAYYPVEDANPDGTHGDYADMNGWKAQQWNVMYYTRDSRAGQPILADSFVVQYGNSTRPDGYTAFGEFGVDAAADLNKHAFKEVQGIYLFYKTAEPTSTTMGLASVFSNVYYAITALAGLVVGAGAMLGVGAILNKNKRKKDIPTEA